MFMVSQSVAYYWDFVYKACIFRNVTERPVRLRMSLVCTGFGSWVNKMNFQQWGCTVLDRTRSYYYSDYLTTLEIVMGPNAAFTWYSSVIKFNWQSSSYSILEIDATLSPDIVDVPDGWRTSFPPLADLPSEGPEVDPDEKLVGDSDPPQDLGTPEEELFPSPLANGRYVLKRIVGTYVAETLYHQLLLSRPTSAVPEYPFEWTNAASPSPIVGTAYGTLYQPQTPNGPGYLNLDGDAPSWSEFDVKYICLKPVSGGYMVVQPQTGLVLTANQQLGSVGNYGGGSCFETQLVLETSTGTSTPVVFQAIVF